VEIQIHADLKGKLAAVLRRCHE